MTNLKITFPRYRLSWDESDTSGHTDPWYMELAGKNGKVYPLGENGDLGAMLYAGHPKLKSRLLALGIPWQIGDDEVVIRFAVGNAKPVFRLLGIRPRRQLSDVQRANAIAVLKKARESRLARPGTQHGDPESPIGSGAGAESREA